MSVSGRARLERRGKSSPSKFSREENIQRACDLRRKGLAYYQIAEQMGVSRTQVTRYVDAGLEILRKRSAAEAKYIREIEDERLVALLQAAYSIMENALDAETAMAAMDRIVRIGIERRKLWGADEPVKVHQTGSLTIYDAQDVMRRANAYFENKEIRDQLFELASQVEAGLNAPDAGGPGADNDGGD